MNKKMALCVGINDYPGSGSDLSGCVNDMLGWERLLSEEGYVTTMLANEDATHHNVTAHLQDMVQRATLGDRIVFTYSGHGSWVPDTNGDEPDRRDEVLCLYDYANGGLLKDDELYSIAQQRNWGVRMSVISDSCFSGTVARFGGPWRGGQAVGKARFLPPVAFLSGDELDRAVKAESLPRGGKSRPATILMSGADDTEYSYDAYIDNKPQGAFSAAALKTYRPGLSFANWHKEIRTILPSSQYPQSPQLQGSAWQKRFGTL